jgi:hypothetical protein
MKEELLNNIDRRFQVLFTLSIFFSTLIYYLGQTTGQSSTQTALVLVQFGGLVGFILIDYILFQLNQNIFQKRSLELINRALLWFIGTFTAAILALSLAASIKFNLPLWVINIAGLTMGTLIIFILAIPVLIELLIIILAIKNDRKQK